MPGQQKKGSFWWRDILKLIDPFKGITAVSIGNGNSVLIWEDTWCTIPLQLKFPQLHSFAKQPKLILGKFMTEPLISHFHLPLSVEAYQQLQEMEGLLNDLQLNDSSDIWQHMGQSCKFSCSTVYKHLSGHQPTHPAFRWLWKSSCQPKHKVFFWLLMHDRINTRGLLRRKNMKLDS